VFEALHFLSFKKSLIRPLLSLFQIEKDRFFTKQATYDITNFYLFLPCGDLIMQNKENKF